MSRIIVGAALIAAMAIGAHQFAPANFGKAASVPVPPGENEKPIAMAPIPSGKPTDWDQMKKYLDDKFGGLEKHLDETDGKVAGQQQQIDDLQRNTAKLAELLEGLAKNGKLPPQDALVASEGAREAQVIAKRTNGPAPPADLETRMKRLETIVAGLSPECLCRERAQRVVKKVVTRWRTRTKYIREPYPVYAEQPAYYQQQEYYQPPAQPQLVPTQMPAQQAAYAQPTYGVQQAGASFVMPNIQIGGGTKVSVQAYGGTAYGGQSTANSNAQVFQSHPVFRYPPQQPPLQPQPPIMHSPPLKPPCTTCITTVGAHPLQPMIPPTAPHVGGTGMSVSLKH